MSHARDAADRLAGLQGLFDKADLLVVTPCRRRSAPNTLTCIRHVTLKLDLRSNPQATSQTMQGGRRRRDTERSSRLIEQLALRFEELESDATDDELAAERAVARTTTVRGFTRKRGERQTFPEHLSRERVMIEPPTACECHGGNRLRKLGEDVTRTLEVVPGQWRVIETVREKFSCRDCEKISQARRHSMPSPRDGPARACWP